MVPVRYRALFALPGFTRLLASSISGRLPIGMSALAILLLTREATHSFAVAGLASGAFAVSEAVASPIAGILIDRFGTRVLIPSSVAQAGFLVALVLVAHWHASAAVLIAMAAGVGGFMPPVTACTRTLLPRVTPDRDTREAAYALDATAQEIVWTAGPLVVGVLAAAVSPALSVLVIAAVTLTGSFLFATAPAARLLGGGPVSGAGSVHVLGTPALRVLLAAGAFIGLGMGMLEVAIPALAIHNGSHAASGLLLSAWSIGSMAGGVFYGARTWQGGQVRRFALLLLGLALTQAPLMLAWSLASAFPLALLAGVCAAPAFSCLYSLIGEHAPGDAVATAFTWNTAAVVGGVAGGSALGGVIVSHVAISAAFALGSSFGVAAALVVFSYSRWLAVGAPDGLAVAAASGA
jgi:MFS family permease